jgi:hypothetical protein
MNLHPLSFSKLRSAKVHATIGGSALAAYYGWMYVSSPDKILGIVNDPLSIITYAPDFLTPLAIAVGGVIITSRVIPFIIRVVKNFKFPRISIRSLRANLPSKIKGASAEHTNNSVGESTDFLSASKAPGKQDPGAIIAQSFRDGTVPSVTVMQIGENQNMENKNEQNSSQKNEGSMAAAVADMIEKKTSAVSEEVTGVKKEVESFKTDIEKIKTDLSLITSTFESSMVELKAFQAEMVNPINFMRKYIETLEIRNLSDPVNTIRQAEAVASSASSTSNNKAPPITESNISQSTSPQDFTPSIAQYPKESRPADQEQMTSGSIDTHRNISPSRHLSNNAPGESHAKPPMDPAHRSQKAISQATRHNSSPQEFMADSVRFLTPGKIMSIVSVIDEMLATMGPDGIELIIEQYKALGMKQEEERLIYGVLRMLNESKLLTDDIIAMFYRFGQVLGINDEEAEIQYMKLIANRKFGSRNSAGSTRGRAASAAGDRD